MIRRRFIALVATLISWPFMRLGAQQNAVKGRYTSEETGESCRCICPTTRAQCSQPRRWQRAHRMGNLVYWQLPNRWSLYDVQEAVDWYDMNVGRVHSVTLTHADRRRLLALTADERIRYPWATPIPIYADGTLPPHTMLFNPRAIEHARFGAKP